MGYIENLRSLVGTTPLILVGAAALIFDEQNRLLLLRRTDNELWGVPGGMMEPGEYLPETVKRETREETGLEIDKMEFFGVFSGPEFHYCYPNGDEVYNVSVVYCIQQVHGDLLVDPAEHSEFGYFDLQSIPSKLSPPIIPIIEKLLKMHGNL